MIIRTVAQDPPCDHYSLYIIPLRSLQDQAAMDINFRKIDVDKYDEDVLLDEELYDADPRDPAQILNDTKAKVTTVRSALSK